MRRGIAHARAAFDEALGAGADEPDAAPFEPQPPPPLGASEAPPPAAAAPPFEPQPPPDGAVDPLEPQPPPLGAAAPPPLEPQPPPPLGVALDAASWLSPAAATGGAATGAATGAELACCRVIHAGIVLASPRPRPCAPAGAVPAGTKPA